VEHSELPNIDVLAALVQAQTSEGTPADRLRAAIGLGRQLSETGDALIERFVVDARAAGLSWAQVGELFGTSKQAAQKRYRAATAEPEAWPGRWTPARRALDHAAEQARELGHNYVGTEHLLLALLADGDGLAAHVLAELAVTRDDVLVHGCVSSGDLARPYDCLAVQPRLKQALEHAQRIAHALGHQIAGSEHLLAGILAVPDALAVELLAHQGVSANRIRAELAQRLEIDPEQLVVPRRRRRRLLARAH
jgi:hypothetical protein